ncbi:TetR/AcrR family transcriptional regulator [Nonomuraea sp. NPDC059194]|uniref:TetR/AcrR family transcriptional regulator n=1 Tax=Nonomuraea sp. NPDC059194 TaxID=3346764 RepID=UPI00367984CA
MDHKILETARALIEEVGYPDLTVDQVAARAGIGKAAIYRRYGSKAEMAFAASVHGQELPPLADTGSLHGDLLALARTFHVRLSAPATQYLGPALANELAMNPDLVTRFQNTFLAAEQANFAEIIDRAVNRGELAAPVDPVLAHVLIAGSLSAAIYILRLPVDDEMVADLTTAVTAGLTTLAGARPSHGHAAPGSRGPREGG